MNPSPLSDPTADFPAYSRALFDLLGERDPLDTQREAPEKLRAAIAGISDTNLRRSEKPGKWSIAEVIQHVTDSEMVYGYRIRACIADDGTTLAGYDQDDWAERLHYENTDVEAALEEFEAMRAANLRLLSRLTDEEWERAGMHEERGRESVRTIARLLAGHDLVHLRQIERIKASLGFDPSLPTGM